MKNKENEKKLNHVVEKALADSDFRKKLMADPDGTLQDEKEDNRYFPELLFSNLIPLWPRYSSRESSVGKCFSTNARCSSRRLLP